MKAATILAAVAILAVSLWPAMRLGTAACTGFGGHLFRLAKRQKN
jgi:hypothetical protein